MRQKIEWLFVFWKREWERCKKDWLKLLSIEIAVILTMCILFLLRRSRLDEFVDDILRMPSAVYAFWGITSDAAGGTASFYMKWALMPLQVFITWWVCDRTVRSVWLEEEQGGIYVLCNQWYSRQQIALAKYLWNVIQFILSYCMLFVLCAVLAGNSWGIGALIGLFLKGILVIMMFLSVSYCYAVVSERKSSIRWADFLVFGTLAIGNLYKAGDLITLLLQRSNRDYAGFYRMTHWLYGLKWISPLSWLNPYAEYGIGSIIIRAAICLTVIAGSTALGLLGYRVRKFE